MKLLSLITADIHRDGGSCSAEFATDGADTYGVWLACSSMPDAQGLHHRWLFEYRGASRPPPGAIPIVTGSDDEQRLLLRLDAFLAGPANDAPVERSLPRLKEMREYIQRREPCFPSDLRRHGFVT